MLCTVRHNLRLHANATVILMRVAGAPSRNEHPQSPNDPNSYAGWSGGALDAEIAPLVGNIVTVLAVVLLLSLGGLVVVGLFHGDPAVRNTLTHVAETVLGVFVGIAAGRLAAPR